MSTKAQHKTVAERLFAKMSMYLIDFRVIFFNKKEIPANTARQTNQRTITTPNTRINNGRGLATLIFCPSTGGCSNDSGAL
jgi:hypothetical protein